MAGMTLVEASKLAANNGDQLSAAIGMKFASESQVLGTIPFQTINGTGFTYNREETLPGVAFRGVNETFTPSTGVINPLTEALRIVGGNLDVDPFIIEGQGTEARTMHTMLKVKAAALLWTKKFIKGSSTTNPREFDGLQTRLTGGQVISNGTAGLSLDKLREAIDQTDDATHIIMSKAMRRRLTAAAQNTSVGGFVSYDTDSFARRVTFFDDLPILEIDRDEANNDILDFSEASSTTSIYVVSFNSGGVFGIQSKGLTAEDMGRTDDGFYRTRVDWYNSIVAMNSRAATRLSGITNAAVTA